MRRDLEFVATPTRTQTFLKGVLITMYRDGVLPMRFVQWAFDRFDLRNA